MRGKQRDSPSLLADSRPTAFETGPYHPRAANMPWLQAMVEMAEVDGVDESERTAVRQQVGGGVGADEARAFQAPMAASLASASLLVDTASYTTTNNHRRNTYGRLDSNWALTCTYTWRQKWQRVIYQAIERFVFW